MVSRRQVLGTGTLAAAAFLIPSGLRISSALAAPVPGGTLNPNSIRKYGTPLFILPAMPTVASGGSSGLDTYSIAARQISQQILPSGSPATTRSRRRCTGISAAR